MGLGIVVWAAVAGCSLAGVAAMAQSQQQQQQSSSHLGQVAKRHGGEEANPANGTTNNVLTVERTPSPGAGQVRGGNGVTLPDSPETAKHPVTDTLHGDTVTDDYRWLEQQHDPQTRSWIDEQNAYTDSYLQQVTIRPEIRAELTKLERVETYSMPTKRGDLYFFKKRLPDENQGSIYIRHEAAGAIRHEAAGAVRHGVGGADERLVDAGKLSADQNTSIGMLDVTNDGTMLAYGIRQGGADEQEVHLIDVATRKELPDRLTSQRYMGVQISPDKKGLYYAVFHHSGTLVYWHPFGTEQSADKMIFGKEYKGEPLGELDLISVSTSDNGHWLILSIGRGVPARREDILLKDLRQPDAPVIPLIYGIDNRFNLIDTGTDTFLVETDMGAPKRRILRADPDTSPQQWQTVVPETKDVIQSSTVLGGRIFVDRLVDVKDEISIYSLDGKPEGTMKLPGIGSATVPYGRPLVKEGFYSFTSFNVPPTIFRYEVGRSEAGTGATSVFARPKVPFHPEHYEVRQVFFTSKDGTRVPMFIAGKKGLPRNGKTPLLLSGYGGFNISTTPYWNPMYAWWLEQGGWFAVPNMRGGGEYGEDWHKAGMFGKKQNVFDDFFAATRYLIDEKYTDTANLAIWGRSNGGLLIGAAMTQHPELYGAIVCGYPLLDMLRYQNFEFGRLWTTEYGSADNAADYKYIRAYSPYQNVKQGTKYPAIMFFSGDNDTRVDPLHARKMAAEVQAATGGDRPILLHYSLKGGHSSGVSVTQQIQDETDILSFLWNETDTR
ncbi:MAG: prolyl oligopeptidase [Acidobacteriaceae bacterium]|jgi:prolyl oligopeptidase|nr:prolyl oligopeptidase [Acidobacteriaceae bacterium]